MSQISMDFKVRTGSVEEAPKYNNHTVMLKIDEVFVVKKGTQSGKTTIDIRAKDKAGRDYLIVTTGALVKAIGQICQAQEEDNIQ